METITEALQLAEQSVRCLERQVDQLGSKEQSDALKLLEVYRRKCSDLRCGYYVAVSKRWYLQWKRFLQLDQSPSHYWNAQSWNDAYPTGFDDISAASSIDEWDPSPSTKEDVIEVVNKSKDTLRQVLKSGLLFNQDFMFCTMSDRNVSIDHYFPEASSTLPIVQCYISYDKVTKLLPSIFSYDSNIQIAKVYFPILIDYTYRIFGMQNDGVFPNSILFHGETFNNYRLPASSRLLQRSFSLSPSPSSSKSAASSSSSLVTSTITVITCLCNPLASPLFSMTDKRICRFELLLSVKNHFLSLWGKGSDYPYEDLFQTGKHSFYTKMNDDNNNLLPPTTTTNTDIEVGSGYRLLTIDQINSLYYTAKQYEKLDDNASIYNLFQRKYCDKLYPASEAAAAYDYRIVTSTQPTQSYHLQVMVEINGSPAYARTDDYGKSKREEGKEPHYQQVKLKDFMRYTYDRLWSLLRVNDWVDVGIIIANTQNNNHLSTSSQQGKKPSTVGRKIVVKFSCFQAMVRSIEIKPTMIGGAAEGQQSGGSCGREWFVVLQRGDADSQQLLDDQHSLIHVHYQEGKAYDHEQPRLYPLYGKTNPSKL